MGLGNRYVVFAVFLLIAPGLFALDPARRLTQYARDRLQREDGLPQNSVQAIAQTRDGYLWFATEQGLARYDGARLTSFGRWNTPQFGGDDVQTLFEDRSGTLWLGSHGGGLVSFRNGRFTRMTGELASGFIWSIAQDAAGALWVATEGKGLIRVAGGRTTAFTKKNGLADDTVYAVLTDRDGSIWAGTLGGLSHIRGSAINNYTVGSVKTLYQDRAGTLWLGTRGGGAARYQNGAFTPLVDGLPNLDIFAFAEDRDGNVWIATGGGGLVRWRDGVMATLTTKEGLANDTVLRLLEDAEGSLWIGTDGGGVTRLRDAKFVAYGQADGLSHEVVMSVYDDGRGAVWLGTLGGGVNRIAGGTVRAYTQRDGLSNDMVFAVRGDRSGAVWVGTRDGLNRIDGERITVYRKKDGLASSIVSAIHQDRRGDLWFGSPDGVSRLRDGRFTTWTTRDGLPADFVLAVTDDRNGAIWLGTAAGLCRFDGQTCTTLTTKDGLADDLVMGLHEDDDGVLWVATRKGLSRMAGGRITTFSRRNGLPDDLILGTLDDHAGYLWVSSNNGVFRLRKKELASVHAEVFGIEDGLPSLECNGGVQPAAWRGADGTLWFPTVKGVAAIDPRRIRVNRRPPPLKIQQVLVDEHPVAPTAALRLPAGTHRVELQYAALTFIAPEQVRFRYRLEGFDAAWIEAGNRRSAVYTNLGPGTYRFLVTAANSDGVWSVAPATLAVEQLPFFRQTAAFLVLCVLAGAALVALFLYLWTRRVRAEFAGKLAERSRIALELHDTVAQELVGMRLLLDLAGGSLGRDDAATRDHLERAAATSRNVLQEVRRVLADLRPAPLEDESLPAALKRFAPEVVVKGTARPLRPEVEDNLLRIAQEAITNALRHAQASRVEVELIYAPERVELHVRDDGIGVSPREGRFGLQGMRERAERMNAELRITSKSGEGTEIAVEVEA